MRWPTTARTAGSAVGRISAASAPGSSRSSASRKASHSPRTSSRPRLRAFETPPLAGSRSRTTRGSRSAIAATSRPCRRSRRRPRRRPRAGSPAPRAPTRGRARRSSPRSRSAPGSRVGAHPAGPTAWHWRQARSTGGRPQEVPSWARTARASRARAEDTLPPQRSGAAIPRPGAWSGRPGPCADGCPPRTNPVSPPRIWRNSADPPAGRSSPTSLTHLPSMPGAAARPMRPPAAAPPAMPGQREDHEQHPTEHGADDGPGLGAAARLVVDGDLAVRVLADDGRVARLDLVRVLEAADRAQRGLGLVGAIERRGDDIGHGGPPPRAPRSAPGGQDTPMSGSEPTFRIDPIEPSAVGPRFTALIDRLEPLLLRRRRRRAAVARGGRRPRGARTTSSTRSPTTARSRSTRPRSSSWSCSARRSVRRARGDLANQWRKCRVPVISIAPPTASTAATTSASRTEPPGWANAVTPAARQTSTASANG